MEITESVCLTQTVGCLFYQVNAFILIHSLIGYCSRGEYSLTVGSAGSCAQSPAGYYKPYILFGDNYYICGQGYYSLAGATACTVCSSTSSSDFGSSVCSYPTGQPSARPTSQPTDPSSQPTGRPSSQPSGKPSLKPSVQPTSRPTSRPSNPTGQPSAQPSSQPTSYPSRQPTSQPTNPTGQPSSQPTGMPSHGPSGQPTLQPTNPTGQPTSQPSRKPSNGPSGQPTSQPTSPTGQPSAQPSSQPTRHPSGQPTSQPTNPTGQPSSQPTGKPSRRPSGQPTLQPTNPTGQPSGQPSPQPSSKPSGQPSYQPTTPTGQPSTLPTLWPSSQPTSQPSSQPTNPSGQPTSQPSSHPSAHPTGRPSDKPSRQPSSQPTSQPTCPTANPTSAPSGQPSSQPSSQPTSQPSNPTGQPTAQPSEAPSGHPTGQPSSRPSSHPSAQPTSFPSCQPTARPSSQPSEQPTSRPTCKPTMQPTARPSVQPTGQPSMQPTGLPSSQPTSPPSGQPSGEPSSQPSRQPTSRPSSRPSSQPSCRPSTQPSCHPTSVPTSQPSDIPTSQPTTKPTCQPSLTPTARPSGQPSSQPSVRPIPQPTSQPSPSPSIQPSTQPTALPTSYPSRLPSALPSSRPSRRPTMQPSERPTMKPSVQPTNQPTAQPFVIPTSCPSRLTSAPSSRPTTQPLAQPTRQPTRQPYAFPTSQPSGHPTAFPIAAAIKKTARPTPRPTFQPTSRPSSVPTADPTQSISSLWRDKLDEVRDLYDAVHYQEAKVVRTLITYFDVSVDDEDVSDSSSGGNGCYRWNQFLSLLTAIQIGYETSYVTVMSLDSLTTELSGATNVTCNLASIAESITDALMSNYGASSSLFSAPCLSTVVDGRIFAVNSTWKVGRCGISPFLEVWVNSTQFMQLSPCNASCDKAGTAASPSSIGVIRGVGVQFRARHQAPTILSLVVIAVYKSTISVTAQLNDRGLVYCAAYDTASYMAPSSVGAIMMASVSTWSSGANGMNISYLNITGLAASTNYTVLCFASSVQSISTPLQTVLTMYNRTVTTSCCRQLSITLLTTAMVLSSSARSTSFRSNALMIAISSLPMTTLSVSVCLTKDNVAYNSAFSPSTLTFDSSASSVRPLALTSLANAGTYNLTVTLSGSSKHLYETVISGSVDQVIVLDASSTAISVPAPKMLSATFSSDGINISIVFDRSINLGQELGTNVRFACSRLFRFGDSSAASISICQFGANGTVVTVMPALSSILSIGSNVTLLGTTVKAACFVNYNCSGWEYAPSTTLLIGASVIQTVPTVSITAPNNIGACTNYVIDVSGSIGSGYRNWKSINYAVESTATNITDLQSYVSDLSTAPLLRMTIPYIYLNTQRLYSITVMMCNFLDVCGQAHVSLTVSSLSAPVVSVVGAAVISVRASQSLTLKAAAYTTSCGSTSSTAANLAYSWSLLSRSAIIGQIASANAPATTTSSLLSVGAYALTPLNTYEIVVSVTSLVTKQTSTASVTISVLQGDLVAVVGGGLSRSVRAVSWATMDGSNSYDSDQAAHGNIGIAFIWSMYQLSPTFQSYCYVRTVGNSATSLRVFGFTNATNSTCVISLAISLDTRTATTSISVYFMSSDGPKVTISFSSPASLTHISVSSKISVSASPCTRRISFSS
jgi:hypothetical protein